MRDFRNRKIAWPCAALLVAISWGGVGRAQESDPVERARRACIYSAEQGSSLVVNGQITAEVKANLLRILGQAGGQGSADITLEQWDGLGQVLEEHRRDVTLDFTDCMRNVLPMLIGSTPAVPDAPAPRSDTGALCRDASSALASPVLVEAGMCFTDATGTRMANILRADRLVVVFENAAGTRIDCYPQDTCGFGFENTPRFGITSKADGIYLVSKK